MINYGLLKHLNLIAVILNGILLGMSLLAGFTGLIIFNSFVIGLCSFSVLKMARMEVEKEYEDAEF